MNDEDIETAVMDVLPHAIHPMHDNWRAKAIALIEGLHAHGYEILPSPTGEKP